MYDLLRPVRAPFCYLLVLLSCAMANASGQGIGTANLGANQVTVQLLTSTAGEAYFTLLPGSAVACGSAAQVAAGLDSTGASATRGALLLSSEIGNYTVRNLTANQGYTICATFAGLANVISKSFTTTSPRTYASPGWAAAGGAGFTSGVVASPSLAFSPEGVPTLAFALSGGSGGQATVMQYNGTAWTQLGTGLSGNVGSISLAFSPAGTPYVAYVDGSNGGKATVMKLSGSSWQTVGSAVSASGASSPSLAFGTDGAPYLAYLDGGNGSAPTVMHFDGSSWTAVGSGGVVSTNPDSSISLAISPAGTAYVALNNAGGASVMQHSTTDTTSAWLAVGAPNFTSYVFGVNSIVLAISPSGTPTIALTSSSAQGVSIMQFDGTSWNAPGGYSSVMDANYPSLAFTPAGLAAVSFQDGSVVLRNSLLSSGYASVTVNDGFNWQYPGPPQFSAGTAFDTNIAFSPAGDLYVAYVDGGNSGRVTVMQLTNVPTATTGAATDVSPYGATLHASVNDEGKDTSVSFQYVGSQFGPQINYGAPIAATTGGTVAAGSGSTPASLALSSLSPGTTYHFRAVANIDGAVINGADATFTTPKGDPIGAVPAASMRYDANTQFIVTFSYPAGAPAPTGFVTVEWGGQSYPSACTASAGLRRCVVFGGFPLPPGTYPVTATERADPLYNQAIGTGTLTLTGPALTFIVSNPTPSPIVSGQPLSASSLAGGTAYFLPTGMTVPGSFVWADPTTVVPAGTNVYSIVFIPTDATDYATATGFVVVTTVDPPVASSILTSNVGANQVTLQLNSSTTGTGYFTVLPVAGGSCGTAARIAAGTDSVGTPVWHGSLALTAGTVGSYTVRNLVASTTYTVCFTPNGSAAPVSASVMTGAAVVLPAGGTWSPIGGSAIPAANASSTSLAFAPDGTPYVAFVAGAYAGQATVLQFNGHGWTQVGSGLSSNAANTTIAFSPDGTLYLGYSEGYGGRATVQRYTGGAWQPVGPTGFPTIGAHSLQIAFSPDGAPYLAIQGETLGTGPNLPVVMSYTGSSWQTVGSISTAPSTYLSLAFGPDGSPYVAYIDGTSTKATVQRFDGTAWQAVGVDGVFLGRATDTSIFFAPDGTPSLAYINQASGTPTLAQYDGSTWQAVGNTTMSGDFTTAVAFGPDGKPYLTYFKPIDSTNGFLGYNGNAWTTVSHTGTVTGYTDPNALSFAPDGSPFLLYRDASDVYVSHLVPAPIVTTGAATSITTAATTLNATVNDDSVDTAVTFQYGTDTTYGSTVTATTGGAIVSGQGDTASSVDLTGLMSATTYHFRAVGTAGSVVVYGSDSTFTTSNATPTAVTGAATAITSTGATLHGTVNDNGSNTTVTFEYGTDTSYGNTLAGGTVAAGTGSTASVINLSGLAPDTTYHFRINAIAGGTTVHGADATFTTLRTNAYVQLSPNIVAFGGQAIGTTANAWTVNMSNTTGIPVHIFSITLGGANPSEFVQTNGCGSSLAAYSSCTIRVSFAPDAATSFTGTIFVDDDASNGSQTVSLSGNGTGPTLQASPSAIDFGTQTVGATPAVQTVTLSNTGAGPVTLTGISIVGSSTFTQTNNCGATLAHGANCTVTVTFKPTSAAASSSSLTVGTNAAGSPQIVPLSGTGNLPVLLLSPNDINFGSQAQGTTGSITVNVSNTSSVAVHVSSVTIGGVNAAQFSLNSGCGSTVAAYSSCSMVLSFTPNAAGSFSGTLAVADDASGSPQTVALSGTGVAPTLQISPSSLDFGTQTIGATPAVQTVTIANTGGGPVTLGGITLAGGGFTQTSNCGAMLAHGANCTVTVTFTPTADTSYTATMMLADNATGSPHTIVLTGSGAAPVVTLSQNNIAFGSQTVTTSSNSITATLNNQSGVTVSINSIAVTGADAADFTQTNTCGNSLAAHSTCNLQITFAPLAVRSFSAALQVATSAGNSQSIQLTGTGTAILAALSPSAIDFGAVTVGASATVQQITLANTTAATLHISGITIAGANAFTQTNNCGATMAPNKNCTIVVSFTPAAPGNFSAMLAVADDAAGTPQTVALTGASALPLVTLSPSSIDFGSQPQGTASNTVSVNLSNTSGASVSISGIVLGGANALAFSQSNSCGTVLAKYSTCNIVVTFKPTATGAASATLTVTDGGQGGSQSVGLSGTGAPTPDYTITSIQQSLTLLSGETGVVSFTLSPTGGYRGTIALGLSGLGNGVTASFAPATLTADGTNTPRTSVLTIHTQGPNTGTVSQNRPIPAGRLLLLPALSACLFAFRRRKLPTIARDLAVILILVSALSALSGCGAGTAFTSGTQAVTVTATSGSGSATTVHTASFTLSVKTQ